MYLRGSATLSRYLFKYPASVQTSRCLGNALSMNMLEMCAFLLYISQLNYPGQKCGDPGVDSWGVTGGALAE